MRPLHWGAYIGKRSTGKSGDYAGKRKGLLSYENKPFFVPFGGDKRDRTADLLNAIQALSQLSYTPVWVDTIIFLSVLGFSLGACKTWYALPAELYPRRRRIIIEL